MNRVGADMDAKKTCKSSVYRDVHSEAAQDAAHFQAKGDVTVTVQRPCRTVTLRVAQK